MTAFDESTSPYCYYFDVLETLENRLESIMSQSDEKIKLIYTHQLHNQQASLLTFKKLQQKILDLQDYVNVCIYSLDSPRGINTEKLDKKINNYNILISKIQDTLNLNTCTTNILN